jgi:hypothetical protein
VPRARLSGTDTAVPAVTPAGTAQPVVVNPPPATAGTVTGAGTGAGAGAPTSPPTAPPATRSSVDPPQTNTPATSAPNTPATNAAAATAEIGAVIDAYARAIESRDIAELRRVYPSITGDQAAAFTDFFKSTRTLRASLAVKSSRVDGSRGTAHVAGTYEFTTTAGRNQQQQVTFDAELRRDAGSWKLVAIR